MTDLLGVSKSLHRPPFRSCLREKGLTRGGVPRKGGVRVAGGNMSDWLLAKPCRCWLRSQGLQGELRRRYGLMSAATCSAQRKERRRVSEECYRTRKMAWTCLGQTLKEFSSFRVYFLVMRPPPEFPIRPLTSPANGVSRF